MVIDRKAIGCVLVLLGIALISNALGGGGVYYSDRGGMLGIHSGTIGGLMMVYGIWLAVVRAKHRLPRHQDRHAEPPK